VVVDEFALQVRPGAPAGTYWLRVGLYQALTGERAAVADAAGHPMGDSVTLAEVQIAYR
jgi:hypothetical protein